MSSLFEAQFQTMTGRKPWEPMLDEPQSVDEVRMPVPEPDDDDPRTLPDFRELEDDYDDYEAEV